MAAGTVVAAVALLLGSRSDFVAAVAHAGGNYHKIVAASLKAGYAPAGFSLGQSILSSSPAASSTRS